jgi:hypothetical protein
MVFDILRTQPKKFNKILQRIETTQRMKKLKLLTFFVRSQNNFRQNNSISEPRRDQLF